MSKLSKAQPAASKAVEAILKVHDSVKQDPDKFELTKVKKDVKKKMENIQTVDKYNTEVVALAIDVNRQGKMLEDYKIVDVYVMVKTYCPEFMERFDRWKAQINAL